ncbi:hypothetical protein, partial [Pseudomonas aeruginosa]|uniref:hypothetical protein n=1 Tax=Pseudomonas aeruginosa TaxID=287 RepID=UPI0011BF4F51
MAEKGKPWYVQNSTRWAHFRSMPFKRLWVLMAGMFLLFSVIGPFVDLIQANGEMPYLVVVAIALTSGINAVLWILVLAKLSRLFFIVLIVLEFLNGPLNTMFARWMVNTFK